MFQSPVSDEDLGGVIDDEQECSNTLSHNFESVYNFRDLSEVWPSLKPGKVFRSATPCSASESDVEKLLNEYKIKTILDLRKYRESAADPGPQLLHNEFTVFDEHMTKKSTFYKKNEGLSLYHVPILPKGMSFFMKAGFFLKLRILFWKLLNNKKRLGGCIGELMSIVGIYGLYEMMLEDAKPNICRVLEMCMDETKYPILIHCTQGKDRTGILAALILICCGAPVESIFSDYIGSQNGLRPLLEDPEVMHKVISHATTGGIDMTYWMTAPKEAIEDALMYMTTHYGSPEGYLDAIGFKEEMRIKLRRQLMGTNIAFQ